MHRNALGGVGVALVALAVFPGVASAQTVGLSTITEQPVPVRALGAFVLVFAFGGGLLYQYEEFVDQAVTSASEGPLNAVVYGFMAQGGVVFVGIYALTQVGQVGAGANVTGILNVVMGVLLLALAGLGFTVVGTRITEWRGNRHLRRGLLIGATLSGAAFLLPSVVAAAAVWSLVVAAGVGASTRKWVHDAREVESGTES